MATTTRDDLMHQVDRLVEALGPMRTWWTEAADATRAETGLRQVLPMTSVVQQQAAADALEECANQLEASAASAPNSTTSALNTRLSALARAMCAVASVELDIGVGAFAAAAAALDEAAAMTRQSVAVRDEIARLLTALNDAISEPARQAIGLLDDAFSAFSRLEFGLAEAHLEGFVAAWSQRLTS